MKGTPKYYSKNKPAKCPKCGGRRIAKIIYGMPSVEMAEAEKTGRYVLGGCYVTDYDPQWQCQNCETQIYPEKYMDLDAQQHLVIRTDEPGE